MERRGDCGAANNAIKLCEESGDHAGVARAWRVLASINGRACRYGAAAVALEQAIDHARRAGDVRQERRASVQYAQAAVYGPTPVEEGILRCEEIARRAEGDRQAEAVVACLLGQFEAMRGDFERARALYRRALAMFEELGLAVDAATVSMEFGRAELLADAVAAEHALRRGYDYFSQVGERYLRSSIAGLLAEALFEQGLLTESEALTEETEKLAAADDVDAQTLWRVVRARILADRGERGAAEQLAREAVELLEPTDYVISRLNAFSCLALVVMLDGGVQGGSRRTDKPCAGRLRGEGQSSSARAAGRELEIELAQLSIDRV